MPDPSDGGFLGTADKVLTRLQLLQRFGRPRVGRLVFTNGCFDLLHPGHIAYLEAARALGDALVIGVNTDSSVRRLKGPSRPFVPEGDRARLLAALSCVSAVVLFSDDTPEGLVRELMPDVLVKGGDYEPEQVVGREAVVGGGGRVEIIPFLEGYSTSALERRIRDLSNSGES